MVINLSLVGSNGDVIPLDNTVGFVVETGFTGMGIPVSELRVTKSAGDGGTWRSTRKAARNFDVPLVVTGATRDEVEAKLRRFSSAISDRYGVPKLRAEYDNGDTYEIEVHYISGAETTFGKDANNTLCRWVMTWQAPDPYWVSSETIQLSVKTSTAVRGMLAAPVGETSTLSALRVSTSQALGSLVVENPGDVDAYPTWTIAGPCTNVSVTLNGVGFEYTETLTAGQTVTIDTRSALVTNSAGTNKYAYLGTAPKLFRLPPGTSTVSITATGADTNTRVNGNFNPRREVLH